MPGGYSGETFAVRVAGEQLVLRIYLRCPERAAVDLALLGRLARVLPVPEIIDARTTTEDVPNPPFLLTRRLGGVRLDEVLAAASPELAGALGRSVGAALALIGTQVFARPGGFVDATLQPHRELIPDNLHEWVDEKLGALWPSSRIADLHGVVDAVQPLLEEVADEARLVHSDFNPKNLLVDPESAQVSGVLDWEFAYAGSPLADVGNMLRFPPPDAFARTFAQTYEDRAPAVPENWLEIARALDLWALVELAAREGQHAVADSAAALLRQVVEIGDVNAGRPDPRN